MSSHFILEGHEAVPADAMTWSRWFEGANRIVAKTVVGSATVSTVFLGLNHQFGEGPPLIFETLVFGGPLDGAMDRYSTWAQAEAGHAEVVARAKASDEPGGS